MQETEPLTPSQAATLTRGTETRSLLQIRGLEKRPAAASPALFTNLAFSVAEGEVVALLGESGVGKSTLLNCIAGLDTPEHGTIQIGLQGVNIAGLDETGRAALRAHMIGFVFQAFHILPTLTVEQNIAVPLLLNRIPKAEHGTRVDALLERVGLAGFAKRWPASLSGGELQRVAIARAIVHRPSLLLADEPTGNLDPRTAAAVLSLLVEQVREERAAALVVTHSHQVARCCDRTLLLTPTGLQ